MTRIQCFYDDLWLLNDRLLFFWVFYLNTLVYTTMLEYWKGLFESKLDCLILLNLIKQIIETYSQQTSKVYAWNTRKN